MLRATRPGLEPGLIVPKTIVLPLDDRVIYLILRMYDTTYPSLYATIQYSTTLYSNCN